MLKDYQTDFADKTNNFPKDLVNMQERMSIACNEDKFLKKKKSNDKNNKDKGKIQIQMTMWHMLQVLHKLRKERKYVGFVVEII